VLPAIHASKPSRSRRKCRRASSGVMGGGQRAAVHRAHQRLAVVFVESGHRQRVVVLALQPGLDAGQRLALAPERTGDHGIEDDARGCKPLPEALALALSERAQLVVVGSAERGLAVADEVERAHGLDCAGQGAAASSPRQRCTIASRQVRREKT